MKQELSILIPVYNDCCLAMVKELSHQCAAVEGLKYEIIVADDGSTDEEVVATNNAINELPYCRYVVRGFNSGRAAIRNFLATEAKYNWLLFIDGDMMIRSASFISTYLSKTQQEVVCGGYTIGKDFSDNLRYCYELAHTNNSTAEQRRRRPYQDFHTSNFMISHQLMTDNPFNERFRHYGYEDVFFGKQLMQQSVTIEHIDNPVVFETFETNDLFLKKTEEGLRTLFEFHDDLRGYSRMLTFADGIHLNTVKAVIRLWHLLFGRMERRWLTGRHPNLTVFKLYKIGYFISLTKNS